MYNTALLYTNVKTFNKALNEFRQCRYFEREELFYPLFNYNIENLKLDMLVSVDQSNSLTLQLMKTNEIITKLLTKSEYYHVYPDYIYTLRYEERDDKFTIIDNIKWKPSISKVSFKVWRRY